ncbi:MAG: hypothetical protein Q7S51_10195 [Gallionellaceae bacterium]|nr:hypothetical protein [Gallionellaceae bacterium]
MLMTLLSLLGGGFMRLLPELIGLWNKKTDNAHELDMLEKQFQLEQTRASARAAEIAQQGDIDQVLALLASQKEALAGQMQLTGNKFVDALNMLVRPLTTYYFLALYGLVKLATIMIALQSVDAWHAILQCWSVEDAAILSSILAFWFVGRVFDKKKPQQ